MTDSQRDRGAELEKPNDFDAAFPILTRDVSKVSSTSNNRGEGELGRLAQDTISNVLGWKFREGDTKGFLSALTGSFDLKQVEGHTEATHTPRGFAVMADLGAVTGGQASLAARARTAVKDSLQLLDSLTPLKVDFDPQDAELFRSLVRSDMEALRGEFESPLIRVPRVDQLFEMLLGVKITGGAVTVNGGGTPEGPITDENVGGHLGRVRDEFGLVSRLVNTIEEERMQTSFITLVDWNVALFDSWLRNRKNIDPFNPPEDGKGFFGPALIALSQLLAATAGQVEELWMAMDSVLIYEGEREVLRVPVPGEAGGSITLGGLTRWVYEFAVNDGKKMAELGKDGVDNAFISVAQRLEEIVGALPRRGPAPERDDTVSPLNTLPQGYFSRRVQVAIDELHDDLQEIVRIAIKVHHGSQTNGSAQFSDSLIQQLVARLRAEMSAEEATRTKRSRS
ncbi:hypothetical protein D5S17_19315 [Pseudonocardiaceae bacterium YIM PH 21723]|nr:hypothetical protein D5S17_19315 [Pseudonocardiaceae bacterium YIM PH 21723]